MQLQDTYTFDEICRLERIEGLPEAKTVLTQVEFTLASVRARGGRLIKFIHDEQMGHSLARLRGEVRRLLRSCQKEGRVVLMIPGEKFSMSDAMTRYLVDKCPKVELDVDMDQRNEYITVVYL